uniref:Uncharacterized protein n=1 Tax=Plectus sambesii TaxID=2011161 RepID=A0A914WAE6_9BILA
MTLAHHAFLVSLTLLAAIYCHGITAAQIDDIKLAKRAATTPPPRNVTSSSRDSLMPPQTNSAAVNRANSTTEERARANYANVIDELNAKFRGFKENCYPRPKGCLCVVGKAKNGTEITDRRMKEEDCKCAAGQTGPECPAGGA